MWPISKAPAKHESLADVALGDCTNTFAGHVFVREAKAIAQGGGGKEVEVGLLRDCFMGGRA